MKLFFAALSLLPTLLLAQPSHAELKFDSDVEAATKNQMLQDLNFMATIQGSEATPFHQQVFGAVDGATYSKWFTSRVLSVGKNDCGNSNAVACVIPYQDHTKMWVTENYTKFDHPQIARLSVIYHEARHTENANRNWPHATCPTPFKDAAGNDMKSIWTGALLQGQPACDKTAFGSYGSQTILLKNIALNCTNCNSKVKADADLFGDDQLNRITQPSVKTSMMQDFGMKWQSSN